MKNSTQVGLRRELRSCGASTSEIDELAKIAGGLSMLRSDLEDVAAARKHRWPKVRLGLLPVSALTVAALLLGMAVVAFSQNSLPGSWMYPVKRVSENVAVTVQPSYRATLMMRRADEVRQLIANGANQGTVSATLHEYQAEASAYKGTNYPAFEYCKSNLQHAEKGASPSEVQMITGVLQNLGDIK